MPLSAPSPRQHLHTREVDFQGFRREDGLWDIEAHLRDAKTIVWHSKDKGDLAPGTPIHDMWIRVTMDDQLTVRAIESTMDSTPFGECLQAEDPMQKIVGLTMGPGWRFAIEKALGGIQGCTHLRELLFNMATAAYQTIAGHRMRQHREAGASRPDAPVHPPYHLGKCLAWDFDGAVVARHFPQYAGWKPLQRQPRKI